MLPEGSKRFRPQRLTELWKAKKTPRVVVKLIEKRPPSKRVCPPADRFTYETDLKAERSSERRRNRAQRALRTRRNRAARLEKLEDDNVLFQDVSLLFSDAATESLPVSPESDTLPLEELFASLLAPEPPSEASLLCDEELDKGGALDAMGSFNISIVSRTSDVSNLSRMQLVLNGSICESKQHSFKCIKLRNSLKPVRNRVVPKGKGKRTKAGA